MYEKDIKKTEIMKTESSLIRGCLREIKDLHINSSLKVLANLNKNMLKINCLALSNPVCTHTHTHTHTSTHT